MADATFPCRTPVGRRVGDRIQLTGTHGGMVAIIASRNGDAEVISVYLSPEDILQFATEALRIADLAAETETH